MTKRRLDYTEQVMLARALDQTVATFQYFTERRGTLNGVEQTLPSKKVTDNVAKAWKYLALAYKEGKG